MLAKRYISSSVVSRLVFTSVLCCGQSNQCWIATAAVLASQVLPGAFAKGRRFDRSPANPYVVERPFDLPRSLQGLWWPLFKKNPNTCSRHDLRISELTMDTCSSDTAVNDQSVDLMKMEDSDRESLEENESGRPLGAVRATTLLKFLAQQNQPDDGGTSEQEDEQSVLGAGSNEDGCGSKRQSSTATEDDKSKKKRFAPQPTHFLGVRLKSEELHSALTSVQSTIIAAEPLLRWAAVSMEKLHITLMVIALDDADSCLRASEVLLSSAAEVNTLLQSLSHPQLLLPVVGLSDFKHQVLFANFPHEHPTISFLYQLADIFRSNFAAAGMPSIGLRFSPHATLFKMSKVPSKVRKKGLRHIKPSLYADMKASTFGTAHLKEVQLLSMVDPPASDGYYHQLATLPLGQNSPSSNIPTSPSAERQDKDKED